MTTFDDYLATFDGDPGYLDWAAFGALSPSVRAEVFADADLLGSGRASSQALVAERHGEAQQVIAEVLSADPAEITLQPSATYGLMHALFGLSGAVIASTAEFPSISVTLERASQLTAGTVVPRWITPPLSGWVTPEAVEDALDEDVVAVAVSHVDFRTGFRTDLGALRELIGPDRLLIVDAVQAVGVVDADYSIADVVVGNGFKWLRAGRGTGFARFSERARERIVPVLSGFAGNEQALPVDEVPPPAAGARAYSVSIPDHLAVARLAIGMRDVRDAGVAAVEAAIADKVDTVIEIADRHGIPVRSPRNRDDRAGIVVLAPSTPAHLAAALANAGVTVTTRGDTIRVAPHAGTADETMQLLDDAIASAGNETFTSA